MCRIVGLVALLLCVGAPRVRAEDDRSDNVGMGHLTTRSISPGHLLRPNVSVATIPERPMDTARVTFSLDWGNVANYEEDLFTLDAEWFFFALRFAYALTERVEGTIVLPFSGRSGGLLDGLIEGFHEMVGLDNDNRTHIDRDVALIDVLGPDGARFVAEGNSWGVNDIPIILSCLVTRGGRVCPAVSVQGGITFPIGKESELEGISRPLFGASALASKRLGTSSHILFGGVSFSYTDQDRLAGIELYREEITAMLGWEYQVNDKLSIVAQYIGSSPAAVDYPEFSDAVNETNMGVKYRIGQDMILEWSFQENLFPFNNSADFGMHLGLTSML